MSEFTFLLPYLEQVPLYSSINMSFANIESAAAPSVENRTSRNLALSSFLCPSDATVPNHLCSYRFNRGRLGGGDGKSSGFDGPFNIRILPSARTVTDGLSNTAFASERFGGTFMSGNFSENRDIKDPVTDGELFTSDAAFIPFCLSAPALTWSTTSGRYWFYCNMSDTHYNHNGRPNDTRPSCNANIANDNGFGLHPPRSYHNACVNVLFGDGHSRAVPDGIEAPVWQAMGTHASGDFP
jgi:prepilin-type processing-associated H-X9-DG protein